MTRLNQSTCIRRWAIWPKKRRSTTPTIRSAEHATSAMAPMTTAPALDARLFEGGRQHVVGDPPEDHGAAHRHHREQGGADDGEGEGSRWALTEYQSRRAPRRMIDSASPWAIAGRT